MSIVLYWALNKDVPNAVPITTTKVDTFYKDTAIAKWKRGKDIYHDTTIYDTQYKEVDTNAILSQYFAKNIFSDTLSLPEGEVSILDTISRNMIYGRSYAAKIRQKTIKETIETTLPAPALKPSLYWGIMATQQDQKLGFGGGLIYKSTNKGIIQLNITNAKQIQLGYYSKIF